MTVEGLIKFLEERMDEDFGKKAVGYIRDGRFYALCGFVTTKDPGTVALGFKDNYSTEKAMTARDLYDRAMRNTHYNPNDVHDMPYMMDLQAKIVDETGNSIHCIDCSDKIIIKFQSDMNAKTSERAGMDDWIISIYDIDDEMMKFYTYTGSKDECMDILLKAAKKMENIDPWNVYVRISIMENYPGYDISIVTPSYVYAAKHQERISDIKTFIE